jgi:histidyl-tRNA synthetase
MIGILGGPNIPAVGFSLGVDRIFTIIQDKLEDVSVLVISDGPDLICERMAICTKLWYANIRAEFVPKLASSLRPQISYADKSKIPFVIIVSKTSIVIKNMRTYYQVTTNDTNVITELKALMTDF